jgi:hypothetical protein
MALVYLVNKPQVSSCIVRWLHLLLEYEFIAVYKLGHTHVLYGLLDTTKLTCVFDSTKVVVLF